MASREEDALSWEGDDDPTLVVSPQGSSARRKKGRSPAPSPDPSASEDPAPNDPAAEQADADAPTVETGSADATDASPTVLPEGWHALGPGRERVSEADVETPEQPEPEDDDGEPAQIGNVALVTLGVLGGVYLLFTIGWFVGASRLRARIERTGGVADVMFTSATWLAVAAPAIWFVTTLVVTRAKKTWVRIAALVLGVLLLAPWPFIMVGVMG